MTASESFNEMKFEESAARGRRIAKLEDLVKQLEAENEKLREELRKKKLKVGPLQHPGQLSIGGTEEAK